MPEAHSDTFTIGIGGAAGDGVREAGNSLGAFLAALGYEVFVSFTYASLIRGGHNFARLSFRADKVWTDHDKLDVLIALNEETANLHRGELQTGGVILADLPRRSSSEGGSGEVGIPMLESAKNLNAPAITRSSVAFGALCYLLDLPLETMTGVLAKIFQNKLPEANLKLAQIGYEHLQKLGLKHIKKINSTSPEGPRGTKELVDGNTAFARGLLAAGLDFYVAYPMTPATSILHFLAGQQAGGKIKVIQPESELSVINMALGISYAGKRVAVGSATGGFALMTEALSFSGGAELPLAIAVSQRQAPATGLPTFSSQTDLRFVLHAGHGEFPRVVIAPGDAEEAFAAGALALNLAWQYQLPAIVLLDKIISEHAQTARLDASQIKIERGTRPVPGTPGQVVKVTSYEHDEQGLSTEELAAVKISLDKRFAKGEALKQELEKQETVKVYGDSASDTAILFWGSTKGPVLEAAKYLKRPVKLVQVLWLEPFPTKKLSEVLAGAKKIINIECNHDGQLGALVREKTGIAATANILKYDSRPFSSTELTNQINGLI